MKISEILEQAQEFVVDGLTKESIDLLFSNLAEFGPDFSHSICLLENRVNTEIRDYAIKGIGGADEHHQNMAKITDGILSLIDDINSHLRSQKTDLSEKKTDHLQPVDTEKVTERNSETQVENLIEYGKLSSAMDKFQEFMALMNNQQDEFEKLQNKYIDLNKKVLKEHLSPEELKKSRDDIRVDFTNIVRALDKEIPKFLQVVDLPVLTRSITDQKELIKLAMGAILEDYCSAVPDPEDGRSCWYFRAQKSNPDQDIVIKVLKVTNTADLPSKEEIKKITSLISPNIIRMDKYNFERLPAYVSLDYINGIILDKALDLFGGFPLTNTLEIMTQLVGAFAEMRQKNILHTNIRPSKIFIDEGGSPKISSLDIIKFKNDNLRSLTRFKEECQYLSPEVLDMTLQTNNMKAVERSDQFSFGLLLLEMLGGKPLFYDDTVSGIFTKRAAFFSNPSEKINEILPDKFYSKTLVDLVKDMLEMKSEKRRPNLEDVLKTLKNATDQALSESVLLKSFPTSNRQYRNLMDAFYENLFTQRPELASHFGLPMNRQYMMLRLAINIVFEIERKEEFFEKILSNEQHKRYTDISFFKTFLYTLRDTVKEQVSDEWDETTMLPAWDDKIQKTLSVVEKYLEKTR